MRSLTASLLVFAFAALGCGPPDVEVPTGNDQVTSDRPVDNNLVAPNVQPPPSPYPFTRLALRGSASNAARVFIEGAGNTVAGEVKPIDQSFCVEIDLNAAPAHYTLKVQSQSGDGRLSQVKTVELDRANDAPAPPEAKLCDGSPPS